VTICCSVVRSCGTTVCCVRNSETRSSNLSSSCALFDTVARLALLLRTDDDGLHSLSSLWHLLGHQSRIKISKALNVPCCDPHGTARVLPLAMNVVILSSTAGSFIKRTNLSQTLSARSMHRDLALTQCEHACPYGADVLPRPVSCITDADLLWRCECVERGVIVRIPSSLILFSVR
jgi:hypothetical protein